MLFHRNGKKNLTAPSNDLVILRQVIPWQGLITRLVPFYKRRKGRRGKSLRMMVAVVILSRLRHLSDEGVIQAIRENRSRPKFPPLKRGYLFDITTIQGKENFRLLATLCPGVGAPDVGGEWVP